MFAKPVDSARVKQTVKNCYFSFAVILGDKSPFCFETKELLSFHNTAVKILRPNFYETFDDIESIKTSPIA